jgi:hypothetical protein
MCAPPSGLGGCFFHFTPKSTTNLYLLANFLEFFQKMSINDRGYLVEENGVNIQILSIKKAPLEAGQGVTS